MSRAPSSLTRIFTSHSGDLRGPVGLDRGALLTLLAVNPGLHVGGTVSGLDGKGLVLALNDGYDTVALDSGGAFRFGQRLPDGSTYAVTVQTAPNSPCESCTLTHGTGTLAICDRARPGRHGKLKPPGYTPSIAAITRG